MATTAVVVAVTEDDEGNNKFIHVAHKVLSMYCSEHMLYTAIQGQIQGKQAICHTMKQAA